MKKSSESSTSTASDPQQFIASLIRRLPGWASASSADSNIVLSTRIRLARNLRAQSFPTTARDSQLKKINRMIEQACTEIELTRPCAYIPMETLDPVSARVLVERRLVSPAFSTAQHPRLAIVDGDEQICIMVNEEDHLRLQSMRPGLSFAKAWELVSELDDELSDRLDYAFSAQFGYLTSCPTNTGTGMRASILVHLPALSLLEEIDVLLRDLASSEIIVRGFYGEGTEVMGNIYQISNQLTLGRSEDAIIKRLEEVAQQFFEAEMQARRQLLEKRDTFLEDKVFRAFGTLQHARVISSQEFLDHLSLVRLGIDVELIDVLQVATIGELMLQTQPAHMQKRFPNAAVSADRDILRARIIRDYFHTA